MFVSRIFLSCSSVGKSEFNAEVNQPYEAYVMVYILAVSLREKTFLFCSLLSLVCIFLPTVSKP